MHVFYLKKKVHLPKKLSSERLKMLCEKSCHVITNQRKVLEACKSILKINLGGGFSPILQVYAPIFLKLHKIDIRKGKVFIYLYCHKLIKKGEVKVNLYGYDNRGEGTFDEQVSGFKSTRKRDDIAVSSSNRVIESDNATHDLKLVLYHDKIEDPLELYARPFRIEPLPPLDAREIQRRKEEIKRMYDKAKKESNHTIKGKLLEQIISDLLSLVPSLKIIGKDVNSGIEEIDLEIQNENSIGIWTEFERMIFVECKNWSDKVGSNEIRNFEGKLRNFWLHAGIFVAVKGFTGRDRENGAVGQNKLRFKQEGFIIILLDGKDLDDILNCQDISEKINEKRLNLFQ
jgi:Restriction endonuclease